MKTIAAAFGTLFLSLTPSAFAAPPASPIPQPAVSSPAGGETIGAPPWLAATTFCSGDCDLYCGSGVVEKYYEPSAACCTRNSCLDGSQLIMSTWHPPSGCWGGGECFIEY